MTASVAHSSNAPACSPMANQHEGKAPYHTAIRGELGMIQGCVTSLQHQAQSRPKFSPTLVLQRWQITALTTILEAHIELVHEQDAHVAPLVAQHMGYYPDQWTHDHERIVSYLGAIQKFVHRLKVGDDSGAAMTILLSAWKAYRHAMEEHLEEVEAIGFPFMHQNAHPFLQDVTQLVVGSIVYHTGQERFRKESMKQEGIPVSAWYLVFRPAFQLYQKTVLTAVATLQDGTEPHSNFSARLFVRKSLPTSGNIV